MKKKNILNTFIIIFISIYLLFPLVLTFIYSTFNEWTGILPTGFTFQYYIDIFQDSLFIASLLRSLFIAFISVFICTIVMILVLYVTTLYLPKLERIVETLCTIPYAIQGIIIAVGVLSLYSGMDGLLGNRLVLLIGTYCIVVLPYIYRGLKNSLNSVSVHTLIEAAVMLGCSQTKAFFKVVLPNIKSGIVVSMMISIAMIFADFAIVNIIGGSYFQTASMYLYKAMSKSGQITSAIIVVLFLTTLAISFVVSKLEKKTSLEGES